MLTVGEILRQTREQKGLSIKTVVDHTYIQAKFIIALECNDYTVFPAEAYTRGFLRNYAELLDLNPTEVLDLFKRTKDTVVPHYDHEYYKTAISLEPEIQKVEHIETRKAVIEEAIAADESIIDTISTVEQHIQTTEPVEQPTESELAAEAVTVDISQEISITNNEPDPIEADNQQIAAETEPDQQYIEPDESVLDTVEQSDSNTNTDGSEQKEITVDKDGYPMPPSFRQKLVESRNDGGSGKKWMLLGVVIIILVGYFLMSDQYDDPQAANGVSKGPLSVLKQATSNAQKPNVQTIELSGRVTTRCWVSVVADGKTIFEDNLQPNSNFKWQANDNLKVTVGNVSALTDLKLNGKPTNMGEVRSNVAERTFLLKDVQ